MSKIFKIGSTVTVTGKTTVPVAGSAVGEDHTGKTGKVRGYTDLSKDDVIHIVDLDPPIFVNLPGQPQFDSTTGEKLKGHQVDWIEVPASCLK